MADEERPRVYITQPRLPVEGYEDAYQPPRETGLTGAIDKLFGLNGQERYQTWPEKMVREAVTAPGDVLASTVPMTSEQMIAPAQAVSALAGTGILAAEKGALGSAGGRMIQPAEKAPTFYSAVERQVADSGQAKASGDQWLSTLGNKPGVKPEELQYTGLMDFLQGKKSVSKDEILGHLKDNKVELGETVKGTKDWSVLTKDEKNQIADNFENQEGTRWKINDSRLKDWYNSQQTNPTKYSQYQIPGGENYREVLMTLPDKGNAEALIAAKAKAKSEGRDWNSISEEGRQYAVDNEKARAGDLYQSSHWDEPNILAHMRMNDRTIDGKKSLHLEEVQSDWHQQGRKEGYKAGDEEALRKELYAKRNEIDDLLSNRKREDLSSEEYMKYEKLSKEMGEINTAHYAAKYGVPDAPFKKNWHELALKRAIREAAENGYDKLSWTAGEHHPTNPKNLNQTGPEADAADRGMQGFYNNMLPKTVEKLTGQKVQKGRFNSNQNPTIKDVIDWSLDNGHMVGPRSAREILAGTHELSDKFKNSGKKLYHIDITSELRDKVVGKGQPLFSAPPVLVPVGHDPFKLTPVDHDPFNPLTNENAL